MIPHGPRASTLHTAALLMARVSVFIVWSDTRGLNRTVEKDVYFAKGFPSP